MDVKELDFFASRFVSMLAHALGKSLGCRPDIDEVVDNVHDFVDAADRINFCGHDVVICCFVLLFKTFMSEF